MADAAGSKRQRTTTNDSENESATATAGWVAGVARTEITPDAGIWLDGWGARKTPSIGVRQALWAKALALRWSDPEDHGYDKLSTNDSLAVIVTTDLLGFSPTLTESLVAWAASKHCIPRSRLLLNASHNHSGPVVDDVLPLYFALDDHHQAKVRAYTATLEGQLKSLIDEAVADMRPATLGRGCAMAAMAANRRHHREGCAELPQLVDHEVPVLAVYGSGVRDGVSALRAVVFGYSCHATCTDDGTIHGDYPGFAQAEIEHAHEVDATVALFLNGCGADQGPLPRFRPGLDEMYGKILAAAVEDVLVRRTLPNGDEAGGTLPVVGPLHCSCGVADVPLEPPPSREELEAAARGGDPAGDGMDGKAAPCAGPAHLAGAAWQQTSVAQRSALYQLEKLDRGECLSSSVGIRLNAWRFGGGGGSGGEGKSARGGGGGGGADPRPLTLVAGSGEWCVDYSLRLKRELGADSTWVSSYNNELVAYVPSGRVRREGGMEGGEAMLEYRHPSWFVPEVEEVIVGKVHELVEALDGRMPQEST